MKQLKKYLGDLFVKKMKHKISGTVLEVEQHLILRNGWEYFVCTNKTDHPDKKMCVVLGFEQEWGEVWMPEIKKHIVSSTKDMSVVMNPPDWVWIK